MAVVYYFTFYFAIKKFNLMTPGREKDDVPFSKMKAKEGQDNHHALARKILVALGDTKNIQSIDHCATRLRIAVKKVSIVDQKALKQPPIAGLVVIDEQHLQLIIGTDVGFVAEALDQMMR